MENSRRVITKLLIYIVILAVVYTILSGFFSYIERVYPALTAYRVYLQESLIILVAGVGGYFVARVLINLINSFVVARLSKDRNLRIIDTVVSIFLYGIIVAIVLLALHVNLTGVLVGGAVGGVIIGLAIQTVASNLFAGIMVSVTDTVNAGDVIQFHSGTIGGNLIGTVRRVTILFTYVEDINGNLVKLPNSSFLNNTIFTNLKVDGLINYQFTVSLNDDIHSDALISEFRRLVSKPELTEMVQDIKIFLANKSTASNTYSIVVKFKNPDRFNEVIDRLNHSIETAYMLLKIKNGNK